MVIRGKVLDRCCKPVSNAKVSIWYAGDLGESGKNVNDTFYEFKISDL